MLAVIRLGRYTQKMRDDNATERQRVHQQQQDEEEEFHRNSAASIGVAEYDDDDDPQIESFISIIVQAHHHYLPNIDSHLHEVAITTRQELISRLDSRTLRAVNVLGLLHFSNNIKNAY